MKKCDVCKSKHIRYRIAVFVGMTTGEASLCLTCYEWFKAIVRD